MTRFKKWLGDRLDVVAFLCLPGALFGIAMVCCAMLYITPEPPPQPEQVTVEAPTTTTTTTTLSTPSTTAPPPTHYYPLTEYERDLVERVVMAEAGGESYKGQMAVAQCILNAAELRRLSPADTIRALKYTQARPEPTKSVKRAVAAVFDDGEAVFDRDVIYFYAPGLCRSDWHESQVYVATIGCHRFFKEAR